jgi:methyltransferase
VSVPSSMFAALVLFLLVTIGQRILELIVSSANRRRLLARGAREFGARHFPMLVAVHVLLPLALVTEILLFRVRPPSSWPLWLALWLLAQGLRYWAVRTLGEHWNVRVLVVPGAPLVTGGPYRLVRHPNYLAVVLELVAGPMMFGAWRTALGISCLNLVALAIRVRAEERALAAA